MEHLVATVGSNPMPVVLVARQVKPRYLYLLFTEDVRETRNRIENLLGAEMTVTSFLVDSKARLEELKSQMASLLIPWDGACLNYTAGTKHMSIAAYSVWAKANLESAPADAAYLVGDQILWERQGSVPLTAELRLSEILQLHFNQDPFVKKNDARLQVSRAIQAYVQKHGWDRYRGLIPELHGRRKFKVEEDDRDFVRWMHVDFHAEKPSNFKGEGCYADFRWDNWLQAVAPKGVQSPSQIPGYDGKPEGQLRVARLLYSDWIELWLADYLAPFFDEVRQGVQFGQSGETDDPEVDVLARKGHLLYLFSCTVDSSAGLVKSKAYEALHRSQRLGGDRTRYAVVCMADAKTLEQTIRRVDEERWIGHGLFRVFGHEHVRGNTEICGKGLPPLSLGQAIERWLPQKTSYSS